MKVLRAVKYLVLAIVLIPILIGVIGGIGAGNEAGRLENFCGRFPPGTAMEQFRVAATAEGYSLVAQTDAVSQNKESQIAAQLMERATRSKWASSGQVAAIVRKPGIGYYACLVNHDGKALLKAEYLWND